MKLNASAMLVAAFSLSALSSSHAARKNLAYAPSPVDNPLKGLVPYQGDVREKFPHSMEFNYLPLSSLVTNYGTYNWAPLDNLLNDIASRGHQAIFRVYLEYPSLPSGVPQFLVNDGLKTTTWTNNESSPPTQSVTPDYSDPRLRRVLKSFIAELGKRYDGDARVGFITAGLLGSWGEWHNWPRGELFASAQVQAEVMDAYEAAFKITPILLRYPTDGDDGKAPTANRRFGYHDDSFAWGTLDTGRPDDSWFFMTLLKNAGQGSLDKWKTQPIGGEIRPEVWGEIFDVQPANPQAQNFRRCVDATHATWLLDSGVFGDKRTDERALRAADEVRRMGYEFFVRAVDIGSASRSQLPISVEVENRGVAPFYYAWHNQFALLDARGKIAKTLAGSGVLTGLLPGQPARKWNQRLDVSGLARGKYRVLMRVPNPLPNGFPIRFANTTQDANKAGWLTLGEFSRR